MLVLSLKLGEGLDIGPDIKVVVFSSGRGRVTLGIKAPESVAILRESAVEKYR